MQAQYHTNAAIGSWFKLSILEQMGNIGSEVGRTLSWQGKNAKNSQKAAERALELFDLTMEDPRWRSQGRLREIARARELFCHAAFGNEAYQTSLKDLDTYFLVFALAARKNA